MLNIKLHLCLRVFLINKYIPIPCLAIFHIDDSLIRFFEGPLFDKWMYTLLNSKLKHLIDIFWCPNSATTDLEAFPNQREHIKPGNGIFWSTYLDELSIDSKQPKILLDGHFRVCNCGNN